MNPEFINHITTGSIDIFYSIILGKVLDYTDMKAHEFSQVDNIHFTIKTKFVRNIYKHQLGNVPSVAQGSYS